MWYGFWMTNRWLLLNFDTLGGLAVLVTTFFSISTLANGAGLAGVCITSAMAFTMSGEPEVRPLCEVMSHSLYQSTGRAASGQVSITWLYNMVFSDDEPHSTRVGSQVRVSSRFRYNRN